LLYLALIAFLGCVAALSNRPVRRTSALKVLRLLWVRRETGRRSPDSHEPRRRGSSWRRSAGPCRLAGLL